jgi:hypothetical protein
MVAQTCNPSTREAEAGGFRVGSQPGQHSEALSQNNNNNNKKNKTEVKFKHLHTSFCGPYGSK